MNFNQSPGIYDASTDKLIMDFKEMIKKGLIVAKIFRNPSKIPKSALLVAAATRKNNEDIYSVENNVDSYVGSFIGDAVKKLHYIILPENIKYIDYGCFCDCKKLVGICGKNIIKIDDMAFYNCINLEIVDFPNLNKIGYDNFCNCKKLENNTKDGLFVVNDKWLINVNGYKNDELIIPKNIEVIEENAFDKNTFIKKFVFPLKFKACNYRFKGFGCNKEIVLPIVFDEFDCDWFPYNEKVVYKGTEKQFVELINKKIIDPDIYRIENIFIKPYSKEELFKKINEDTYTLKKIEQILDRKLTLDEILSLNHSMKEANEYFKNIDR